MEAEVSELFCILLGSIHPCLPLPSASNWKNLSKGGSGFPQGAEAILVTNDHTDPCVESGGSEPLKTQRAGTGKDQDQRQ